VNGNVFRSYLASRPLFKRDRRDILRPSYIPENLPHRDNQVDQLASVMATALRGERPSNVLIFGKTGTGKTAVVKFLEKEIEKLQNNGHEIPGPEGGGAGDGEPPQGSPLAGEGGNGIAMVKYVYLNCEVIDTQYSVLQNIGNRFGNGGDEKIPFTGWPLDRVYDALRGRIDSDGSIIVVILDEIDKLVKKSGDDILYHLSSINDNLANAKVSLIGISNDLKFTEFLDPRVKSRLGEEKLVFPPYNAEQLRDILNQRADLAFELDTLDPAVIPMCAALAAQEHGDARRALDLLRVAAEIAERARDQVVTRDHVQQAKNKIELDCVSEVIRTLPTHSKLVLFGIILSEEAGRTKFITGDLYESYKDICAKCGIGGLTQRRITDLISELDMLGIIHARVISKGRYGRTREIQLAVPRAETKSLLVEDDILSGLGNYRLKFQTQLPT
jgi:cell division control protein 6